MSKYGKRVSFTWREHERFVERLRALKKEHGTFDEFSEFTGVQYATIKYWLRMETVPGINRLDMIAQACDVNIEWLLGKPVERGHYGNA